MFRTMLLLSATTTALFLNSVVAVAGDNNEKLAPQVIKDLRYGESLFNYYQDKYFSALTNLMIADAKQPITNQGDDPELLKGGLFLAYGLHNKAHDIFTKLINANLPVYTRDRAYYYLGKSFYKKSYYDRAVSALSSVTNTLPDNFNDERLHLLSNIYLRRKEFDKALHLLDKYSDENEWPYYALYNIGVALIREKKYAEGIQYLLQLNAYKAKTEEMNALVDKANLAIGFAYIRKESPELAPEYLRQVRLKGPLSNIALLGIGWAYSSRGQYKNALRPWIALQKRDSVDTAVQESMLAIPYTLEQIQSNNNALGHYQQAVAVYDQELKSISSVISIVESGELIASLTKVLNAEDEDYNFRLTTPPVSVATPYIEKLIAKHEFQQAYLNYRDLLFLQKVLKRWSTQLPAYNLMLKERKLRYQSKFPQIKNDARLNKINVLTAAKNKFRKKIDQIEKQQDIFALLTAKEQKIMQRLKSAAISIEKLKDKRDITEQQHKLHILKGMMTWKLSREYIPRLWKAQKQLKLVESGLKQTKQATLSLKKSWNSAPSRFAGFSERVSEKKYRIIKLQKKLRYLLSQQQRFLVLMAMRELNNKQRALKNYHARARFSVARLYDKIALSDSPENNQGNTSGDKSKR